MAILRGWGSGEDFADEIDDSIASRSQTPDDLELLGRFFVVGGTGGSRVRANGDETDGIALKKTAFTHRVAWRKNILDKGRTDGVRPGGRLGKQRGRIWNGDGSA